MKKIEKLVAMVEETILGEEMQSSKKYKELSQENRVIFNSLLTEIDEIPDTEKRNRIKGLLLNYNDCETKYQGFTTRFAYVEGAKIGYGFGKVEDSFTSYTE
jgi:hypothetical protein